MSGWYGGDDHGDELRRGRDGNVWRYGGDERGGGKQHDDHSHNAGGQSRRSDGDGNGNGQSGSLANGFTYIGPPTVSSVSPNNGPTAGGTAVTITGTNFAAGATVKFGGTAATNVVVVSRTSITATTPAGMRRGAVTVTVTNGRADWKPGQWIHLQCTVAISFSQVAAATPQTPTATVSVTYPGAQTQGT